MERIRRARARRADRRAARRRGADPRHLPRPAAALRARRPSSAARPGWRCCAATSASSTPTASRSRTSAGRRSAGSATRASPRGSSRRRPSTSSTPSRPRPAAGELLGSAAYGARFACAAERDNVFGVQFHPEKSSAAGLRLLSNFAGICAAVRPAGRRDPLSGDRHPRRPGGAPARRATTTARPPTTPTRSTPRRAGPTKAPSSCTWSTSTGPRPASRGTSRRCGGSRRRSTCPIQVGGGLRDADSVAAVLEAGAERVVIGTAALRDPEFLGGGARDARRARRRLGRRPRRQGRRWRAGPRPADVDVAEAVAELSARGVARFLCTAIEVDGTMEGPASSELDRIAAATAAQVIASGGVGDPRRPRSACAAEAAPTSRARSSAAPSTSARFTVAEAIAALRRS